MRVLVGCEWSGTVRDAFIKAGHDAYSCDTEPGEGLHAQKRHIQGDLKNILAVNPSHWDLLLCFPPCTYLSSSGLHWNKRQPERAAKTAAALEFVRFLLEQPIKRIALENPVGCISTQIRPASQYVQPYQFGSDASKKTGLWLKGLPALKPDPAQFIPPRIVFYKGKYRQRWSNQTDSGQNRLGPSETRAQQRGKTYPGIAEAMAKQWGSDQKHQMEEGK